MPYLNVYGTYVVYDRWGEGPDTVLIAYSAADWHGCLLPKGRRYLAADLPGHGRTHGPEGLGEDELAEHLVTLLVLLHLTDAELWVHPRAKGLGLYLSERLGLSVAPAPACGDASTS